MQKKKNDVIAIAKARLRAATERLLRPSGIRWEFKRQMDLVPLGRYRELLQALKLTSPLGSRAILALKARKYGQLFPVKFSEPMEAPKELRLAAAVVEDNQILINRYLALKPKIETAVLDGEHSLALQYLHELQQVAGDSIWALELEISLLQTSVGLQEQKRLASSVISDANESFLAPIATFISDRNEEKTSVDGFIKSFMAQLETWDVPNFIYMYLTFRILGRRVEDEDDVAAILSIDQNSSVIDYYESFVACASAVVAIPDSFPTCALHILPVVSALAEIKDPRLTRILGFRACRTGNRHFPTEDEAIVLYQSALSSPEEQSRGAEGADTLRNTLIRYFGSVLTRATDRHSAWARLYKLLLNMKALSIANPLQELLMRRTTRYRSNYFLPASFALGGSPKPIYLSGLDDVVYLKGTDAWIVDQAPLVPFISARNDPASVMNSTDDEVLVEAMFQALRNKDFELTLSLAERLMDSKNLDVRFEASRIRIEAYALSGDLGNAIKHMAHVCSVDIGFAEELPLNKMFHNRRWRDLRDYDPKELAICLFAYSGFSRDSNAEFNLKQCVVALYRTGIRDEIIDKARNEEPLDSVDLFILRDVLIEDYLNLVPRFKLSEDLDRERLLICQVLLSADKENSSFYEQQIRSLSFKSAVNAGMQQIDQTRIYVDFTSLRRWAEKDQKENFNRWVELSEIDPVPAVNVKEVLAKLIEKPSEVPAELLVIPTSQADQVLIRILTTLLDRFLNDSQDGLNSYLSLRVRHGTLDGMLRSPFKEEDLLTTQDQASGDRILGQSLQAALSEVAPHLNQHVTEILGEFTEEFNSCVGSFIRDEVRVRSDAFPRGLIDISVGTYAFNLVKADLLENKTFDALLENAFRSFSIFLRASLTGIQARLKSHVGETVEQASRQVRLKVDALPDRDSIPFITDRLGRAMVAFQGAIGRAIEWFQFKPGESLDRTFAMEEMLDIAIKMTKDLCPGFRHTIESTIEGDFPQFAAATLISVTDAIFIMLDNAFKHSGAPDGSIAIDVRLVDGGESQHYIHFTVTNDVNAAVATPEAIDRVKRIADMLIDGKHADLLSTEGGTGLAKLSRLTRAQDGDDCNSPLTFGFVGTEKFVTSLSLSFKTIEIET